MIWSSQYHRSVPYFHFFMFSFMLPCLAVKCFVGAANNIYQQFVASCMKARRGCGGWRKLGPAAGTGGCYPQECSHFYWANSWPGGNLGIPPPLLLLTFIYELQHFPWTIMKVAILDRMLIFVPVQAASAWAAQSRGRGAGSGERWAVTQCQCSRKTEKFIALWPGKSRIFVSTHFTFTGHLRFLRPPTSIQPRSYFLEAQFRWTSQIQTKININKDKLTKSVRILFGSSADSLLPYIYLCEWSSHATPGQYWINDPPLEPSALAAHHRQPRIIRVISQR